METESETEYEGAIKVPELIIKQTIFSKEKNLNNTFHRIKTLPTSQFNFYNLPTKNPMEEDKFNCTLRNEKFRLNNKYINSINTKLSNGSTNDKIKKVTFSTVEIIRVQNYKKYNKLNTIKRNENYNSIIDNNCIIL